MPSRRLIAAVAVLCLAFGAIVSALAQSKTKAVIQQEINQDFPDNNTGQITPAIVRGFLVDVMNSYFQWPAVNSQATGPYTLLNTDMGALVNVSSQATFTLVLPQAVSPFYNGWSTFIKNIGPVTATLSPMNSTIGGSSTLSLATQSGVYVVSDGANWQTWGGVGVGTVTSVGLSLPSIFSVNGSPVTISGTLTGNLATQNANIVFAGPSSGAAASPTFRSLISTDVSGAVTGSFTVPSFLNVTGSPCTATCNYVLGLAVQSPNAVFVGPSSGTSASPTFRALVSNDLPTPNTTSLGAVFSLVPATHNFITAINNSGTPQSAVPSIFDLATVTPHSYVGNPTASQATPSSGTLGRTADWNQNTQNDVAMVVDQIRLAASPQFVNAASGTITLNFANGMNFNTTLGVACNPCTIVTPQNLSQTWAGSLILTQASQNSTIAFSKPIWKFSGGTTPAATVTLNDVDVMNFICVTPNAACYVFYGTNYQ